MPLPDFMRKKKNETDKRRLSVSSVIRSSVQLPLDDVPEEIIRDFHSSAATPGDSMSRTTCHAFERSSGRLVKSLVDILSNEKALDSFRRFMESRSAISLLNFCIEVQYFKLSAETVAKCLAEADRLRRQECDVINENEKTKKRKRNKKKKRKSSSSSNRSEKNDETLCLDDEETPQVCPPSPSSLKSVDSGILVNQSECGSIQNHHLTSEEQLLLNQTKEALFIYQRYVAPESPFELDFSSDIRQSIVIGICSESGKVDPSSFDEAFHLVKSEIESNHLTQFFRSQYYKQLLVDFLTTDNGRNLGINDVLENDGLFFHFTEFIDKTEGRQYRSMLDFLMCVKIFRQKALTSNVDKTSLRSNNDDSWTALQDDAVIVYEKFISLQASSPLGFGTDVRYRIETSICNETGDVDSTCFDEAVGIVIHVLRMKYLQKFINSQIFKNYVAELKSSLASKTFEDEVGFLSKGVSSISLNTSLVLSDGGASVRIPNLVETQSNYERSSSFVDTQIDRGPSFLELLTDTDHLWKRKSNSITNIGHVDSMGRYTSTFDLPPDSSHGSSTFYATSQEAMGSKISRVVRRMISNSDIEKDKEELAWQVAHMIISQVTNRSNCNTE